jgi:hypothetical protein
MRPRELFLSHAHEDTAFADHVVDVLVRHGVPTWYSPREILGAQQWHDEIGAALRRCDAFAVILSPRSVPSKWVKRELLFALRDDRYEGKIIPLLLEACDYEALSWTLPLFESIDFTGDFRDGCQDLLRIWGIGYREAWVRG